jgi:hypothetical protein
MALSFIAVMAVRLLRPVVFISVHAPLGLCFFLRAGRNNLAPGSDH